MGISAKTVVFPGSPFTGTTTSGVAQTVTMPTIVLPEASKTFDRVTLRLWWTDASSTATTITGRRIDLGLNGAAKTAYTNTRPVTNSGENIAGYLSYDLTSQFVAQWSGTSMTCELDVTITGPAVRNLVAQLWITYACDDTSTVQVKTVWMPLDMTTGGVPSTKPASLATIPALDTDLPEASKTILGTWVDIEMMPISSVTDQIVSMEISSLGAHTTGAIEMQLSSSMNVHYTWDAAFPTNSTQTWHFWATTPTFFLHPQATLIVTYTYDADASTEIYHSCWYPLELTSPMRSSSDPSRGVRDIWVAESTPTTKALAAYLWWQTTSALTAVYARLGTGSYVTYPDASMSVFCGSSMLMVRNDGAYTLAQGRNTIEFSAYAGAFQNGNVNALILVCYTAPKMPGGVGAHTRTVWRCVLDTHNSNVAMSYSWAATGAACVSLPADAFVAAIGLDSRVTTISTGNFCGYQITVTRDTGGGYLPCYQDMGWSDAEVGTFVVVAQMRDLFVRWTGDVADRQALSSTRTWRTHIPAAGGAAVSAQADLWVMTTFHGHTWTVAGTVSGSNGGTVTLRLCRSATGEVVKESSRVGDGAFSIPWYDATEEVYVDAYEDDTYLGRSAPALAA